MSASSNVLTMELRDPQRPVERSHVRFDGCGGSIGRGAACDWVLDADGVSRLHASVRYLDGLYFLEDHSTNGVLLNGAALRPGFPAALKGGDVVRIDVFEIVVSIDADAIAIDTTAERNTARGDADTAAPAELAVEPIAGTVAGAFVALSPAADADVQLDPLALFATSYTLTGTEADVPAAGWNHAPATAAAYRAPTANIATAESVLPENWDLTRSQFALQAIPLSEPPEPQATPSPSPAAAPPQPGPEHVPAPPSVPPSASAPPELQVLFTAMASGVIDVLRARAELKNSLRLPVTLVHRSENNPLKFAPTVDEAVTRLLGPANPAYLTGAAAIDDAMQDIRHHQMALLAGMRAAFEHLFAHFDPARFEADAAGGSSLPSWAGRPWRRYSQYYRSLLDDSDERFRRLFGDEFARAYEEQMARLKAAEPRAHRNDRT